MNSDIKELYDNFHNESCGFDRVKRLFMFIDSVFCLLKNECSLKILKTEKDNNVKLRFLILLNNLISQITGYCTELSEIITSIHTGLAEDVSKTTSTLKNVRSELAEMEEMKRKINQKKEIIKNVNNELIEKNNVLTTCYEKEKQLKTLSDNLAKLESKCAEYNIDQLENAIQEHQELIRKQELLLSKKMKIDKTIAETKEKNAQISKANENSQKISEELTSISEKTFADLVQILNTIENEVTSVRNIDYIGLTVKDKMQQILPELDTLVISIKQKLKDQQTIFKEIKDAWHGIYEGNMTFTKQYKIEADEISSDIAKLFGRLDELISIVLNTRDKV